MGATNSTQKPSVLRTASRGALTGIEQSDAATGKPVCTRYSAIPYALPPTGERRWRRPVPLPQHSSFNGPDGNPGDHTSFGNVCPQPVYGHGAVLLPNSRAGPEPARVQSEDCLYLNVWVPAGEPPAEGWPVQFFIHGGWLQVGDAMQNNAHDPFDLLKDSPRIIVAATYRLNLFGFMSCRQLAAEHESQSPGNYGFWDQRLALEWTAANIALFGGNKGNISVGGLSAGAYSTIFQLNYDVRQTNTADRLIKRIFLYSNAVGIQPNRVDSQDTESQFEELVSQVGIDSALSSQEKLEALRKVSDTDLASSIHHLKHHTFRAGTDDDFISTDFLSSIHDGSLATLLHDQNVGIMLGEVANEETMYRLVNPATSYEDLILQVNNYYPAAVTDALLKIYPIPKPDAPTTAWRDVGARMIADCQVHATVRGFTACLLNPPAGAKPAKNVFRYRICWRAAGLDAWLDPAVKMCHASDTPIWWQSGRRADFTAEDTRKSMVFLKPFEQFLWAKGVEWGTQDVRQIREFAADGDVKIVNDDFWERGIEIWETMKRAQLN